MPTGSGTGGTMRMFAFDVPCPMVSCVRLYTHTAHEHDMPRTTKSSFRSVDIHFRDIVPGTVSHFITQSHGGNSPVPRLGIFVSRAYTSRVQTEQ